MHRCGVNFINFMCGHFCQKKRKSSTAAGETVTPAGSGGSGGQAQTPYYDDVVLQQRDPDLELKENLAYGPISVQLCKFRLYCIVLILYNNMLGKVLIGSATFVQ
jgi:hypothetical protein